MPEQTNTVLEEAATSLTIKAWCQQERCSPATYYKLARSGAGPKTIRIGRAVRIIESRESWHRRMAELNATQTAKRQHRRLVELASRAGKAAAQSAAHWSKRRQRG
jgi:hypothetical protein